MIVIRNQYGHFRQILIEKIIIIFFNILSSQFIYKKN